jgi:hypothetical protein
MEDGLLAGAFGGRRDRDAGHGEQGNDVEGDRHHVDPLDVGNSDETTGCYRADDAGSVHAPHLEGHGVAQPLLADDVGHDGPGGRA